MPRDLGPQQVIVTDGSVLIHQAPKRPEPRRAEPPTAAPQNLEPEAYHHIAPALDEAPQVDEVPASDVDSAATPDDEPAQVAGEAYESGTYSGSGPDYSHRTAGLAMEIGAPEAGALERVYGDGSREDESDSDRIRGAETLVLDEFVVPHGARIVTRSRHHVPPPPLGWGIEFGTGRLVPIHSFKGRMSYGDHS